MASCFNFDDPPTNQYTIVYDEDSEEDMDMEKSGSKVEDSDAEDYLVTGIPDDAELRQMWEKACASPELPSRDRSRSPLRWSSDASGGSSSPLDVKPFDAAVSAPVYDDKNDAMPDDLLAPQRRGSSVRHNSTAVRGGGETSPKPPWLGARGRVTNGDPVWVIGDKLEKVYVDDDDMPEELKEEILRVEQNEEEYVDSDDGEVESLFAGEGTSNQFDWSANMADFRGEREEFLPQQTGAVVKSENAYGAFRQFWDEDLLTHIVTETNRHAARLADSSTAFAQDWYDTNVHEILVLFSFWMMFGIVRMPTISSCFASNPLQQTSIFRKMFTRNRYAALSSAFHLNDDSSAQTDPTNVLGPLGPIADRLNALFQKAYIPSQNICIDKSLLLWKGTLSPCQRIKTKVAQSGMKTFELCESHTGYLWSFFIHRGSGNTDSNLLSTTSVLKLIKPLLHKGYTLFMDNWFNSPLLTRFLKARKTDCVGNLRANRTDVPPLMSLCKLNDGQFVVRHSGDVSVLTFQDKHRKLTTISTYNGDLQGIWPCESPLEAKSRRPLKYEPQVVLDFNKGMGGVDRKDSMLEPYLMARQTGKKRCVNIFKHLLNCSIFNARILLESSSSIPKKHMVFRLELVDEILKFHLPRVPRKSHPTHPVSSGLSHSQPQERHYPRMTDQIVNGRRVRRRCRFCHQQKKYRRTPISCTVCEVPLCADPCFKQYHASLT